MALQNLTLAPLFAIDARPIELTAWTTVHVEIDDKTSFITIKNSISSSGAVYVRFDNVSDTDVVHSTSDPNNWSIAAYPWETEDRFAVDGVVKSWGKWMHVVAVWGDADIDVIEL